MSIHDIRYSEKELTIVFPFNPDQDHDDALLVYERLFLVLTPYLLHSSQYPSLRKDAFEIISTIAMYKMVRAVPPAGIYRIQVSCP